MSKRAILYTRVSTDEQAEKGYSLPTQLEAARQYAASNGFDVPGPEYEIEDNVSGAKLGRPGLERARAMFAQGEAEAIIVYSADRLSRNLLDLLMLCKEFERAGVEVWTCDRGKWQDTAEGRLTRNVEGVIAEFEREKIRERSRRGRLAKAAAGKWVGSTHAPYGYQRVGSRKDVRLVICEHEAAIVRRIFKLYTGSKGRLVSCLDIAAMLTAEGVPTPGRAGGPGKGWYAATVKTILDRKAYIGELEYGGVSIHLPELALVDRKTWQEAQARRETNKTRSRRHQRRAYLLSGHLRCLCEQAMCGTAKQNGDGWESLRYKCATASTDTHLRTCQERYILADVADSVVWGWLVELFNNPAKMKAGLTDYASRQGETLETKRRDLATLGESRKELEESLRLLVLDLKDMPEGPGRAAVKAEIQNTSKALTTLIAEQEKLQAELAQVEMTTERQAEIESLADEIRQGLADDDVDFEAKRRMLNWLNVRAKVEYRQAVRGLYLECVLPYAADWRPIESGSFQ